ncbi:hypothetical protein U9M48_012670 [Paspalum notatum var. saurae]|uniref:Uncharacterized protein n=1 Tax=Paspalum notatum var. saurae TaxID=547442 RepID=A0AAQ3SXZ1_PASNO
MEPPVEDAAALDSWETARRRHGAYHEQAHPLRTPRLLIARPRQRPGHHLAAATAHVVGARDTRRHRTGHGVDPARAGPDVARGGGRGDHGDRG